MNSVILAVKRGLAAWAPDFLYLALVNGRNAAQKRKHRISQAQRGLYRVDDGETSIFITQRRRHRRYEWGIDKLVDHLASQYNLTRLSLEPGGVFIDCGANVGELGLWARKRGLEYHAFEPESQEAICCDLNNFAGRKQTIRYGLWFEATELKFYSKAGSADSSLIEPADYDSVAVVKTMTLDDYVQSKQIARIEILKVEAEGAEPEVLRGAMKSLRISRYVSVDCGPERGIQQEDTVRDVCNLLYANGFQMIHSKVRRCSLLFENNAMAGRRAA